MIHSHIQSFKSGTKDKEVQVPGFLSPSITCLQLLAHVSSDIRDVLCSDEHFLTNMIKCMLRCTCNYTYTCTCTTCIYQLIKIQKNE